MTIVIQNNTWIVKPSEQHTNYLWFHFLPDDTTRQIKHILVNVTSIEKNIVRI